MSLHFIIIIIFTIGAVCMSVSIQAALTQFSETALVGEEAGVLRNAATTAQPGQTAVCDLSKHDKEQGKL